MTEEKKELTYDDAFDEAINFLHSDDETQDNADQKSEDTDAVVNEEKEDSTDTQEDTSTEDTTEEDGTKSEVDKIKELEALLEKSEQRFRSFEGRIKKELEARKEEELTRQQQFLNALKPQKEENKDELPKHLQDLYNDLPEVASAVEELVKRRTKELEEAITKRFKEKLDPFIDNVTRQQISMQYNQIKAAHPDVDDVRESGKLEKWIETLPPVFQPSAIYVINHGTAAEVISLLDQYKASIKQNTTNKENTTNTDKPTKKTNIEEIKAGLSVPSGASKDPKTTEKKSAMDDFDAGWMAALNSEKK